MADTQEMIADIRREADRLEAAYKRDKAAIEADALSVGGLVEAMRQRRTAGVDKHSCLKPACEYFE